MLERHCFKLQKTHAQDPLDTVFTEIKTTSKYNIKVPLLLYHENYGDIQTMPLDTRMSTLWIHPPCLNKLLIKTFACICD